MTARTLRVLVPGLTVLASAAASCGPLPPPSPEIVAERRARDSLDCGRLLVITQFPDGRPARDVPVIHTGGMDYTDRRGQLLIHAPCGRQFVRVGGPGFYGLRDTVVLSYGRTVTLRRTVVPEPTNLRP